MDHPLHEVHVRLCVGRGLDVRDVALRQTGRRLARGAGLNDEGLLVSHSEPETGGDADPERDPTNFSYVDWGQIADALHLMRPSTAAGNDPRARLFP